MKNQLKLLFTFFLGLNNKFRFQTKIVHWEAESHAQHLIADDFHAQILEFEDIIAERIGGLLGKFTFDDFAEVKTAIEENNQPTIDALHRQNTLTELIDAYTVVIRKFYSMIPDTDKYAGIRSDFENQISELSNLRYLSTQE